MSTQWGHVFELRERDLAGLEYSKSVYKNISFYGELVVRGHPIRPNGFCDVLGTK